VASFRRRITVRRKQLLVLVGHAQPPAQRRPLAVHGPVQGPLALALERVCRGSDS
jgi:hypothetical protein